jgi:hypothetical protein
MNPGKGQKRLAARPGIMGVLSEVDAAAGERLELAEPDVAGDSQV